MEKNQDSSGFFQNRGCRYFPCHTGIPAEEFNCLFCYCPLYTLGRKCGGNYIYTDQNIKSCINCVFPHKKDNYGKVTARFDEIKEVVRLMDGENK